MCGINGILSFDRPVGTTDTMVRMNNALAHRGPDAEGTFDNGKVQFGHRRLSIIDVSENANQPMESADDRYCIVFNGEIYNYRQIKKQLPDYPFRTQSDTEVVLAAFSRYGAGCVSLFNGIFAFAIWDKAKKQLFVARDRLGVKPLYYYVDNDQFIFSSSVKAILATNRVERKIDPVSLVDYMRYQTVHAPATIIESVRQLMPGNYLTVSEDGEMTRQVYWNMAEIQPRRFDSIEAARDAVRDQLTRSVELQLVSDVPFGAFLSGGIDSSLLVALMSRMHDHKVETFSIVFREAEFSEREYSQLIAGKFGTHHHEIELGIDDFKALIPDALHFMDHPSGDGPNTFVVSQKTREAGIKMALSGLGGDELFGGYPVFTQLPELSHKKWLRSFPVYLRRPFARLYHRFKGTVASGKISALLQLEEFETEDIYQFYRQVLMDTQVMDLLAVGKLPPNRVYDITRQQVGFKMSGYRLPELSRISIAEMTTYMQNVLLRDADQMSMASGLEVRVPFLDHELVELVLGIEDRYKRPVTPKKLLVDSFADLLPAEIYQRPKMGFVLPYEKWMKQDLNAFCHERIMALKDHPYFNAGGLDRLWNGFMKNDRHITWSRVWPLVVLSNWMEENNAR